MKELDKSKKYDLSKLNNEQLKEFYDKYYKKVNSFEAFKKLINGFHFMHIDDCDYWTFNSNKFKHDFTITCATELFEEEVKGLTNNLAFIDKFNTIEYKPIHYANGIDTFERMEANCTIDECLAFAKGNIDKYNFRKKGQDLEDYTKIIAYANWAIKLLNKK